MKTFNLLLFLMLFCFYALGQPAPRNENFNNRYEYVSSFLENITEYEEDQILSLILVSNDDNSITFPIVIGVKELYYVLYNEVFNNKEQLYFSVGKMFLKDTVYLSNDKVSLFSNYIVDNSKLKKINEQGFKDTYLQYLGKTGIFEKNLKPEERRAIIFYFDRRFYPTFHVHNDDDFVGFHYSFREFNLVPIYKQEQEYFQIWDRNGVLIQEYISPYE